VDAAGADVVVAVVGEGVDGAVVAVAADDGDAGSGDVAAEISTGGGGAGGGDGPWEMTTLDWSSKIPTLGWHHQRTEQSNHLRHRDATEGPD